MNRMIGNAWRDYLVFKELVAFVMAGHCGGPKTRTLLLFPQDKLHAVIVQLVHDLPVGTST